MEKKKERLKYPITSILDLVHETPAGSGLEPGGRRTGDSEEPPSVSFLYFFTETTSSSLTFKTGELASGFCWTGTV